MQRAGAAMCAFRAVLLAILAPVCWIVPGARGAPTTTVPMAEVFTLEEPSGSSAPLEFPDEYSISIEQAIADRNEFAKAAVLKMIFAMADDIAHERQVSAALFEAVDDLQRRLSRHEDRANSLEQRVTSLGGATPEDLKARQPTSCRDLQQAGHVLSGFYLVRGTDRMETVFCSFTENREAGVSHEDHNLHDSE